MLCFGAGLCWFFFQQGQQKLLRNSPREHNKEPEVSTRRPKFPVSQSDRATVGRAGNKSDPWSPHTPTCSTHRIHNKHHHASTGQSCFACIILKGLFSEGNKVPGTVFKARKVAGSATYKQVKQRDMLASCSRTNYYYFWPSLQISQLLFPPAVTQGETNQQGHNYLWKPFRCCRGHTRRPLTYRLWTLLPDAVNPECSGTVERNNFGPGIIDWQGEQLANAVCRALFFPPGGRGKWHRLPAARPRGGLRLCTLLSRYRLILFVCLFIRGFSSRSW